ncbi:helix-turn-helix domain-containing protein [Microbacterium sp.]|uniref:helix-turn-helix domain-containing protein n=1 Tax=Microbacterium sp. TaxID=51671 RepID=UPI0039E51C10
MDGYGAKAIGARVRAYRRAAGMTADQLAAQVDGLTGNAVAKLENGYRREISTELLVQLAWALKVPPLVLLFPLHDPSAQIELPAASGTSESLGYWIQGLVVPGSDVSPSEKLGAAVHSEHRRLIINSLNFLGDIQVQLTERGSMTAAEASELSNHVDLSAEAMNTGRAMLGILRERLGLDDG